MILEIDPGRFHVNRAYRAGKTKGGRSIVYQGTTYTSAKALLGEQAHLEFDRRPFMGPVTVTIDLHFPEMKRGHIHGDIDGPIKGILDALQDAQVYCNDAQVESLAVAKFCDPERPRIEIGVFV